MLQLAFRRSSIASAVGLRRCGSSPSRNLLRWWRRWIHEHVLEPGRNLSRRQMFVSASIGIWGGMFPFPLCTSPLTALCILMYSLGVPSPQRFSMPMAGIAMVLNQLVLPVNLLFMPGFIMCGRYCYNTVTGEDRELHLDKEFLHKLGSNPRQTLEEFGFFIGLGAVSWAVMTIPVLVVIRGLGIAMRLTPKSQAKVARSKAAS